MFQMTGNHDSRDLIRQVFKDHVYSPAASYFQYTVEGESLRLIILATNVSG